MQLYITVLAEDIVYEKKIEGLITIGVHKGKHNVGTNLILFCEWLMIVVGKDTMN